MDPLSRSPPRRGPARGRRAAAALVVTAAAGVPAAVGANLTPLPDAAGALAAPWRIVALPDGKAPSTRFERATIDGVPAVRIVAEGSYGNLVHDLPTGTPAAGTLRWRWRLEQANAAADLRRKPGDDAALKVCASFAMPIDRVPFVERQILRLARSVSGEDLPAATVCYVWDPREATGTLLPNVYSARLRWIVLRGSGTATGNWFDESRDIAADFRRAFGDESAEVPPLQAIVVGADADNTGGRSSGAVAALRLDR
ncbi:MAG: DUF3047 domain-containing protein [Rubrivivax sp.]|jgi:hypothetical protein|nr:DUF3047 domain-containing protein [Rubrivivax sp.]